MQTLFVYYRIDDPAAATHCAAFVAAVGRAAGVLSCLLRRCDDPRLQLEVYGPMDEAEAAALMAALDEQLGHSGLASVIEGGAAARHAEWFEAGL
jgi:hypothetical protein